MFLQKQPDAQKYFKRFMGGHEFIHNKERWCLWLVDVTPAELKAMPHVMVRIGAVKNLREKSTDVGARQLANRSWQFRDLFNPDCFIAIPEVSSERRKYIPIGFLTGDTIASNTVQIIAYATIWHFGVLTSQMHMTWMKFTCGRLKSDFRYSGSIVYNNFPWPESPSEKQKQAVEAAAQAVLSARTQFPDSSLADLYDPNTMPHMLAKAHQQLDKAVDLCYRPQPFVNETKRMEFLFELYNKYISGLFVQTNPRKPKSQKA